MRAERKKPSNRAQKGKRPGKLTSKQASRQDPKRVAQRAKKKVSRPATKGAQEHRTKKAAASAAQKHSAKKARGRTLALPTTIEKKRVRLRVNKEEYELFIYPHRTLAEVLRDELHLTGTKQSCNEGACGTCTVLLEGAPIRSCLLLAADAEDKEITTIEGLAESGKLHPIQAAFVEYYAIQCGFCTPGMILTAKALLDKNPHPTEEEIRSAIAGNVCRCTGYTKIVEAIKAASEAQR
ncbi:MAG TPA: (2Fe-2S)-binding protein [Syntrophorhabdales bacterium]|nr:(2Fe-2S)-binding protein [Syntrophorhabdales bacterium]